VSVTRREFLLTTSVAAGAVLFAGCVPPPREVEGESRVLLAEDLLSAYDNWYATTCRGCQAGCGVVVRVVDGRARKVEGNPDHPLNAGKLCARGQATVQEQYHPDRLQGPLQRDPAQRASGSFESIGWPDALDALTKRLGDLRQQGRQADVSLITPPLDAHQAFLVGQFASAYGLKWLPFEPVSDAPLREASRRVFGLDQLPWFDVRNARTVLSFGADFLGTWLSPVRFGLEYGIFRQGTYDVRAFQPHTEAQPRGRLIQVDTHLSTTAASADEWVWTRPGMEGVLALSVAQALGASGVPDAYAPEQTAERTGVAAERVRRIAGELREHQPSLVIGGGLAGAYTHGTETLAAILSLNALLGNFGKPGGILPVPAGPLADLPARAPGRPLNEWQDLVARMNDGREQAVLVLGGANPVHGLPAALGFADALRKVPFVASFASFGDDTALLADLVLPSSLPLEEWGDASPYPTGAVSVQQPVVQAIFDTRSAWDVLLALAEQLGNPLPWATFKDLLQAQLDGLRPAGMGQAEWWSGLLQHGVATGSPSQAGGALPTGGTPQGGTGPGGGLPEPTFAGDPETYPFNLVVFPHNTLGVGEAAHLPWLQAAPDPVTSVTWQSWVELNPAVAARLQLTEGDLVAVESPAGRVEVLAYVSPAAPREVLAMPLGQGHAGFGRWANGRGANPMQLLGPLADGATGALAYGATRVRLSKTGRQRALPKLEGMAPARQLPGQEVIQVLHQ
jgi:anaerobic selenocysteine-containing dehydrogenase